MFSSDFSVRSKSVSSIPITSQRIVIPKQALEEQKARISEMKPDNSREIFMNNLFWLTRDYYSTSTFVDYRLYQGNADEYCQRLNKSSMVDRIKKYDQRKAYSTQVFCYNKNGLDNGKGDVIML